MPRQLITIPRNLSAATTRVLYVDAAGASQVVDLSGALGAQPMETNRPVREFFAWPGKRNYEGLWWSSTTRGMIAFESLLERQALTVLDHDVSVVAFSAQPFALLWPRATSGPTFHIPDGGYLPEPEVLKSRSGRSTRASQGRRPSLRPTPGRGGDRAVPTPPSGPAGPYAETMGALAELVDEGAIQMAGISNADEQQIRLAQDLLGDRLVAVQNQFTPDFRSSEAELQLHDDKRRHARRLSRPPSHARVRLHSQSRRPAP
jgi:hypothetical protein